MICRRLRTWSWVALAMTVASAPLSAEACGGFFCNRQSIEQSGERILFVFEEDGSVTTVVQIQYAGPSEEFAWILPVPEVPDVGVGTDALFRELERETAPTFPLDRVTTGTCRREPACAYRPTSGEQLNTVTDESRSLPTSDDVTYGQSVRVHVRADVGPYDVAVVTAEEPDALRRWLDDNGYAVPGAATEALDHYVALGHAFVALQLQKDRDAGAIQPIVLHSSSQEPCVPIRLTGIASVPDMPITVYALADRRARPFNYLLVEPDLDLPALWQGGLRYDEHVTRTVDLAGGHAFVTDFAGAVPDVDVRVDPIDDLRVERDPVAFLAALRQRGFSGDSQLLELLQRHIAPPSGANPAWFYDCLTQSWCSRYDEHLGDLAFDPSALVDALEEAIVAPRRRAQRMLDEHPRLTRLFTTLSPDEMTEDPMFVLSDELPEHPREHRARLETRCTLSHFRWAAPQFLVMPSGAETQTREGYRYTLGDDLYCEDRESGDFAPWSSPETLRATSALRDYAPRGGGSCAAAVTGDRRSAAMVGALVLVLIAARRRRPR